MKNKNRNGRRGQVNTDAVTQTAAGNRSQIERLVPAWSASFENGSKVYQSLNMDLGITVDKDFLKGLIGRINDDDTKQFSIWIGRFAEVCQELGKLKDRMHEEYEERWDNTNKIGRDLEAQEQQLAEQREGLERQREGIEQRLSKLEEEKELLASKDSELLDRERDVKQREINAETGFAIQNDQALRALEERQYTQEKEHAHDLEKLEEDKRQLKDKIWEATRKLAEIKNSCSDAEAERAKNLEEREYEIEQRKVRLERDRNRLEREMSDLFEAKRTLQYDIDSEMEIERKAHTEEVANLKGKLESAWSKSQELKQQLTDLNELQATLGDKSPADLLEQLDRLGNENRDLLRRLDQSDGAEMQQENERLRNRVADLERDLADIRPQLDRALSELSVKRISATELEAVAREKRVLEQHKNILSVHIDDLENRIVQLTSAQKSQTAFPAMILMDEDKGYRSSIDLEKVPRLDQFAEELQHRIAQAEKQVELFYPIEDIRVLLGGLAMSQLHVFQGISGTGKTSLAKAFAKAIGGFCTDIAVQAGWRDRDDLLGHYNAFEGRFYEKDCLQALYKAQTPRWQDTCNVILLDEMNLSRPEQYFAEFLSALEKNDSDERVISLSETPLPNAPMMLREGRKIQVPANVWFIGTANHDETTNELADKTYDRSHVMTLPKQDHRFDIKSQKPASYSFRSLQKVFELACTEYEGAVSSLLQKLAEDSFTEQLGSHFGLGWGNRFEKQALRFIPVMIAAGAAEGVALDHLLATRVMRQGKVTGRYDVAADDIRTLKDSLEKFWIDANLDGEPSKSLELMEADIKRKEGGA